MPRHYRKRRRSSKFNQTTNKLKKLLRFQPIRPNFPQRGKTTCKTVIPFKIAASVMAAGVTAGTDYIGYLQLDNLKDPFGTIPVTSLAGVAELDSTYEATGHDDLDKIYDSYRCTSSSLTIKWWPLVTVRLGIALIPTTTSTSPTLSWTAIMNHPLVKISWLTRDSEQDVSTTFNFSIMHSKFNRMMVTPEHAVSGEGAAVHQAEWTAFDDGSTTDSNIFLHMFLVSGDASKTYTTTPAAAGLLTLSQRVLVQKTVKSVHYDASLALEHVVKNAAS